MKVHPVSRTFSILATLALLAMVALIVAGWAEQITYWRSF